MPIHQLIDGVKNSDLHPNSRRRFAMLFMGRTGSSFTVDVLNQHPDVRFEGEALSPLYQAPNRLAAQRQFLDSVWGNQALEKHQCTGFKTKSFDIVDLPGFWLAADDYRPTILLSRRKNLLKLVISAVRINKRAELKRHAIGEEEWKKQQYDQSLWNLSGDQPDGLADDFALPIDEVIGGLRWADASAKTEMVLVRGLLNDFDIDVVSYDYDDILADPKEFFDRMFSVLGVESIPYEERIRKHTSDRLEDAMSNYGELVDAVRDTKYRHFLDRETMP